MVEVAGKVRVRKAILCATMTKLPRGDVNLNKLNKEAEGIKDKKERNDYITYNMMKVQYHDDVLGPGKPMQEKFEKRLELVRNTNRPAWVIGLQFLAIQGADLREQLHRIPGSLPVMVIHGKRDRMVLESEGEVILDHIKHAKRLSDNDGEFGHFWYEYYDIDYWVKAIGDFLDHGKVGGSKAESKLYIPAIHTLARTAHGLVCDTFLTEYRTPATWPLVPSGSGLNSHE